MIFLGIDVGNSGCKVAAFDENGALVRLTRRAYTFSSSRPGWREIDAESVLGAVLECLTEISADGLGARVRALAVSSQGEAIVALDAAGRVLSPVHASFDGRSASALDWVSAHLDVAELESITGNPRHAMFSLYKLLWIRDNQPEVFAQIRTIASFADWVALRLGYRLVMDHTLASRTSMFDVRNREWSSWILDRAGLGADLLPALAPSGTPIGTINSAIAELTGISPFAAIATGGHDQICASLGAGVTTVGQAMNSMGTTDSVVCLTSNFDSAAAIAAGGNAIGVSALDDYALHAYVMSTGSTTAWFLRTFQCGGASLNEMSERSWNAGQPTGIHFLPHLTGSGTPHLDALSTGVLTGLSTESTPELIYRAILEGISFELRQNLEHMTSAGARIDSLTAIGGAAESARYLQTKADIFGIPVRRAAMAEAGCFGAALLAGHAVGQFPSIAAAADAAVRIETVYEPDQTRHDAYAQMFEEHTQLYGLSQAMRSEPK